MEISNIIIILLFIIPGILAERISYSIDCPSKRSRSDFRQTVNGMLFSLPIILISSIIFALSTKKTTLDDFIGALNNLPSLFMYGVLILLISIVAGIIDGVIKGIRIRPINWVRALLGKMPSDEGTCWHRFLTDQNKARYLEVIHNGNSYKGFAGHYSSTNEDAAIVLEINEVLYEHEDCNLDELFTEVIGIYIDAEKDIVIKDYDMDKYNKWCDEKETESQATSS